MFDHKYLTEDHLKGLDNYKYNAVDTSPLSKYVMHPFWNYIVKFVPTWIAPNVLTMTGFICLVSNAIILLLYDYKYDVVRRPGSSYEDSIPNYIYIACGLSLILAYNLDGIDGKHARRIGVSGPLGELFDHGLDCSVVFLIPFCLLFSFGRNEYSASAFRVFIIIISVVMNSYITHAERYVTGTLFLPWGYDVSMWVSSLIMLAPGIDKRILKRYVFSAITPFLILEVTVHIFGASMTVIGSIYRVWLAYKTRTAKVYLLWEALRPLWSMFAMTCTMILWGLTSRNDVIGQQFTSFLLLYGTMFSNITSRLIVSCMSSQRCDLISWMNWPLIFGIAVSFWQPRVEYFVLHALLVFCLISHIHYGICVVRQICRHYDITCFTVPEEKRKQQ